MPDTNHPIMKTLVLAIATSAAIAVPASPVDAQRRGSHASGVRFDVHLDFGWYGGLGAGFRVDVPIIPDGMIDARGVDDELVLSPGAEILFWDYYGNDHDSNVAFAPLIALQWNFYLSDDWSVFPELGVAMMFGDHWHHRHPHDPDGPNHAHVYIDPFLGGGARYHFSARNALLLRINWPAGLQVGITF
jgi:hypothetical protein